MIKHIPLLLLFVFLFRISIIILGEHTVRIQKNYDKLVHDMASTAHIIDQLVSDGILNPEIFSPNKGAQEKRQCYLVMDLIKHIWYLIHVERQKETVTL
jgi:hypothetical protein